MIIRTASFSKSSTSIAQCPAGGKPEFAFTGRSNVGKSSLINMITGRKMLAKTSGNPGKTRIINHFLINESWYLVDLPGYGYAKTSARMRKEWQATINDYVLKRESLVCVFVLLDSRLKPQKSDLTFMEFLGVNQVPFVRIYTKSDKVSEHSLKKALSHYDNVMFEKWESLPPAFITSAVSQRGKDEIRDFIEDCINNLSTRM